MQRRRAVLRLQRPSEFEALLGSPVRMELLDALQVAKAPCPVSDLAQRLGRKPSALYHHLKKLQGAGLVVRAGTGKSGPRDEALYTTAARQVRIDYDPTDRDAVAAVQRGAAAALRLAERDFRRCVAAAAKAGEPLARAIDTSREKLWLTAADLAELQKRLESLRDFLRSRSRPGRGRLVALTISAAELATAEER